MARPHTNSNLASRAKPNPRQKPLRPVASERRISDRLAPIVIGVSGNEEFLNGLAAIFAEQVLAARQGAEKRFDSSTES